MRVDFNIVENWYPKTFAEKIDKILLKLYSLSKFEGDYIDYTPFIRSLFLTNAVSDTIVHGQEQNNGAYYEAGYALGLGKEVIHICKKSELTSGLHFDVAQVNTIVYDNIEELPAKIVKRIKATIG